ncbi:hypothetical protein NCAS_0I01160 [Naumovozyma castellii]|uniref:C2H2-type domain-containing protein n=1 Tax=Naumovozyma castellii TaxID=27288 RepID=G0VJV3_NAUCA|nr:hypothetical protein NCAS_0I01160 [Naumovozyma castellii CBS 4309]CCC71784.1 hypothetical protein NCAS_0I01160 [Naumovozyma castellii CBS 4309]
MEEDGGESHIGKEVLGLLTIGHKTPMKRKWAEEEVVGTTAEDEDNDNSTSRILCNEPPCVNNLIPLDSYPLHVSQFHDNICTKCDANLVTQYLLELHLVECHNPFVSSSHQPLHCFEKDCSQVFPTQMDRIDHLKNFHNYPDFYNFNIIYTGYKL